MYQYDYDDDGVASSYLMLTLAIPAFVWMAVRQWRARVRSVCGCPACRASPRRHARSGLIATALLLGLVAFLVRNVLTLRPARLVGGFDPWAVLRIPEGSPVSKIKKAFKKAMVRMQRAQKKTGGKKAGEAAMMDVNKAFKILESPEAYENWMQEKAERKTVMAIPSILLRFRGSSIGVYVLVLGVLVPFLTARRYRSLRTKAVTGASFKAVEEFYATIDGFSSNEAALLQQLLVFMARTDELSGIRWVKNVSETIKSHVEQNYAFPPVAADQAYLHLLDHLTRGGACSPEERSLIVRASCALIDAFALVAAGRARTQLVFTLLSLRKGFVQAALPPLHFMLQLPGVTAAAINSAPAAFRKERLCSLEKTSEFIESAGIGEARKWAETLVRSFPRVTIEKLAAFTHDTADANSDLSRPVARAINTTNGVHRLTRGVVAKIAFTLVPSGAATAHAPYAGAHLPASWHILHAIGNEVQPSILTAAHDEIAREFIIELPYREITAPIHVYVISREHFTVDAQASITVNYA